MKPFQSLISTLTLSLLAAAFPPTQQFPLSPLTPPAAMPDTPAPLIQRSVVIADVLGTVRPISSFASFSRQARDIERLLSSTGENRNITVLAPLNSAIENLPHKLWENPQDYATYGSQAYEGAAGKIRADENVRHFVEAHIVVRGAGPWGEGVEAETLGGQTVRWEKTSVGTRVIMPGGIEVDHVAIEVANGEVWILKRALVPTISFTS